VYEQEIKANNLKTRESKDTSLAKFVKTKKSNHIDNADAFIRLLKGNSIHFF